VTTDNMEGNVAGDVVDGSADAAAYVSVCALSELVDGEPHKAVVDGVTMAVVLTEGEVFAINDICSHGQVSLAEGEVEGCALECWLHGSQFDLRTGRPLSLPATDPVPVYPVKVEDGTVFVTTRSSDLA
jgi:3-phenylpropionate/trans-cinnamate dioxygenase ferredoxin subunit